jgi:hypothetical protein
MDFAGMIGRVIRAARLDRTLYEEVESDTSLTQEALIVVVIAALLSGIGSFLGAVIGDPTIGQAFLGMITGIVVSVVGYYIWAFVTYFIGTRLLEGTADYGELQRTLGYAFAPTALGLLGFIPCVGWVFSVLGALWTLVCGVIAIREALDFDIGKAVLTVIIGWIIYMVVIGIVAAAVGIGAVGLGAITGALQ